MTTASHTAPAAAPGQLPGYGRLLAGQVQYQLRLLVRSPRALFAGILLPVLLLAVRQVGGRIPAGQELALVSGIAAFSVISTAFITHAGNLVTARESGVLRRWRASPLPHAIFIAGWVAATTLLAAASAVVALLVAGVLGASISVTGVGLALVPIVLGVLAWTSIGTAMTAFITGGMGAYPLLAAISLPVILLSGGLGFSVAGNEPSWLVTLMSYLPAEPVIDGMTRALQYAAGGGGPALPGRDLAVLAVWTVVGAVASVRVFRWDPRVAGKRPGPAKSTAT
jgi:ABC-2 type transport system permease protein